MKAAVIAVTANGAVLAEKISGLLDADVFVKAGRHQIKIKNGGEFTSLRDLTLEVIYRYDAVVFIMAAGIAVRMIAPYLVHKTADPAVVVIDERGKNVISLLSGHIGGANALSLRIASEIGANPVITTATDVNGRVAADTVAVDLGLRIRNIALLKGVNGAIAAGEDVVFYLDETMAKADEYIRLLRERQLTAEKCNTLRLADSSPAVLITDKDMAEKYARILILSPGKLSAGVGCRRDVSEENILAALADACERVGKGTEDLVSLASTRVKADERGLLAAAKKLSIPIYFYDNVQIQGAIDAHHLESSAFVRQQIGVGNICESTAILSSQSKKIVLRKTKYPGITVALAWDK